MARSMAAASSMTFATEAILAIAALGAGLAVVLVRRAQHRRGAGDPPSRGTDPQASDVPVPSPPACPSRRPDDPAAENGSADRPHAPVVAPRRARPAGPIEVLLAEDNDVNALVLTRLLEKLGCRITRVSTGADAVAVAAKEAFEIVFMDWRMPEMDGLEAIRHIRRFEARADVPIVAVTANALPGDRETCLAAGADDYLTKPVDAASLRAVLMRFVPEAGIPAGPPTASERAAR
ncbi:MAG: response regulator [Myxococcota bacterium]